MDLTPVIRAKLAQLDRSRAGPFASGQRAALWRAQQRAARMDNTLDDLRRYCLEALKPRLIDEDDENDYLRGYRRGFQAVLSEIRRIETRTRTR